MDLVSHLEKNPFVLAPMAGITDSPLRHFMREMGCGVVVSELISAKGLQYQSERTRELMRFSSEESPVGIQLFGEDAVALAQACKEVEKSRADFIDLNLGCPVPKVVKKGAGAALLKNPSHLATLLSAMRKATQLPITLKIRTGWCSQNRNALEICRLAHAEGMSWVAIHGRTCRQAYTGKADWDFMAEVAAKSPLPVLGNGDITSGEDAVRKFKQGPFKGVLIGRASLKNPFIFAEAKACWQNTTWNRQASYLKLLEHLQLRFRAFYPSHRSHLTLLRLKKLASWFSQGFPNATEFRRHLFQIQEEESLLQWARNFFTEDAALHRRQNSNEAFLMGGHG